MSKGASQAQQPVNYQTLGGAQTQSNIATAQTQAALNNISTYSPMGSAVYTPNGAGGYNLNQSLNPQLQALFNQQTGTAGNVGTAAGGFLNQGQGLGSLGNTLAGLGYGFGVNNVTARPNYGPTTFLQNLTPGSFQTNVATGAGGQALPGVQTGIGSLGNIQTGVGPTGNIQTGVNSNYPQLVNQAQNAAYQQQTQYLNPQWSQAQQQLTQQLADQGLQPGSEAADRAQGDFSRAQNQAYGNAQVQAVQAGNAMQQQLYQQLLESGQFANTAQAQQYGQALNTGQFANAAQAQQYAQALQSEQFANQAQQQMFGQGFQQANLYNQAVLGAANQNVQAQQGNMNLAQQSWQDPLTAMQAMTGTGASLYGTGIGSLGQALNTINAAPTWPSGNIPTMGGESTNVTAANYPLIQAAATNANLASANLGYQSANSLPILGNTAANLWTGGTGGMAGLFGSGGLGSLVNGGLGSLGQALFSGGAGAANAWAAAPGALLL